MAGWEKLSKWKIEDSQTNSRSGYRENFVAKAIGAAANKAGISIKQGEDIVEHLFSWMKFWMNHYTMPKIRIMYFGDFSPSLGKINRSIRHRITLYKKSGYRAKLYYRLCYFIIKFWPIRNRLIHEKNKVVTYNEWKKKEPWEAQKKLQLKGKVTGVMGEWRKWVQHRRCLWREECQEREAMMNQIFDLK